MRVPCARLQGRLLAPTSIQSVKPPAECGSDRDSIRIFHQRCRHLQRVVLAEIALQSVAPCDQAVVAVGWRQGRQKREGFSTKSAEAPTNPNPIVRFVMRLFTAASMAHDRIAPAIRTLSSKVLCAERCPVVSRSVEFGRKWDEENRGAARAPSR